MRTLPNILALLVAMIPIGIANRYKGPNRSVLTYLSLVLLTASSIALLGADGRIFPVIFAAVFGGLICTLSLWSSLKQRESAAAARDEALLRGLQVTEVERDVPVFGRGNRSYNLKSQTCTRYSMPRAARSTLGDWSFLMRTKKEGAQYPNGFLFHSSAGEPSADMSAILSEIAKQASEEYLELEGSSSDVSAFWNAWGGKKGFDRVHAWLQQLARF